MVTTEKPELKKIAIVGSPNVGKSVIFNSLTGAYATVSNYPGTTVEVSRGKTKIGSEEFEVIDTPGMYSLIPITEEEKVARSILLEEKPELTLHIIDAKNIERMLPLTIQLIEAGLPLILVVNIIDEAEQFGMKIDIKQLEEEIGVPAVSTAATTGRGINILKEKIKNYQRQPFKQFTNDVDIEESITFISSSLQKEYGISKRTISLLLLQEDAEIHALVKEREDAVNYNSILQAISVAKSKYSHSINYIIALNRQQTARGITSAVATMPATGGGLKERLSRITMNPWTGFPILFLVLYFGLYKFVGQFGAGTIVNFLEDTVFGKYIIPPFTNFIEGIIPWKTIQELIIGEYGIVTLGIRYAIALILPIVGMFFFVFAIIEDTGYLPRLAMLIDRIFKKIGLSGRAVIPMVLGLGCDTMATMVTRTLPTKRERIMATLLLALAVPCSAQLGVIFALLEGNPKALGVWIGMIILVFLFMGFLAAKIIPGEKPIFFMEVPPLRFPKISNVLVKTYTRMTWYFQEIFPLFILASVLIWIGQLIKLFDLIIKWLAYPVLWIGLPEKTSVAYLFGFFRRDYGAAGLYDMNKAGSFTGNQLVIAVVTLTLFLPCIAQFLMNIKERGLKTGIAISVFIFFFAFGIGAFLNFIFNVLGVIL